MGISDSVRYPWAIVAPNGPAFAFSASTWIHWWSPVASANVSIRSWVISSQSPVPRCSPLAAGSSSRFAKVRMSVPRAACHIDHLAGDEAGLLAREVGDERGDVVGRADALHRGGGRGRLLFYLACHLH